MVTKWGQQKVNEMADWWVRMMVDQWDAEVAVVKAVLMVREMAAWMDSQKVDEMVRLMADMWVTLLVAEKDAKGAAVKVVLMDVKEAVV